MIEIMIPKIGVEDGEVLLAGWEKEDGAFVEKDEVIAVVETEKINSEIYSPASGILKTSLAPGDHTRMNETIGFIVMEASSDSNEDNAEVPQDTPPTSKEFVQPTAHLPPSARRQRMKAAPVNRVIGSPAAKRIASELGIDLTAVSGSGPGGAILSKDVYGRVAQASTMKGNGKEVIQGRKVLSREKLTPIRESIAKNMYESVRNTAQMTLMGTLSLDRMWPVFQQMKDEMKVYDIKPSWAALFVKVISLALEEHRLLNGICLDGERVIWEDIHIGVATSTKRGLVVPVIKDANKKDLMEVHTEMRELAHKARDSRLTSEEVSGSTFTLTNVGSYGGEMGTPILNGKELGIIGIGAVQKMPVVNEKDEIVVGHCCHYNLTVDHQMIDGEEAGLFINTIRRLLDTPTLVLMNCRRPDQ